MRLFRFALVLAAVGLFPGRLDAQTSAFDYPTSGTVYMSTEPNKLQISCHPLPPAPSGTPRIECDFAQIYISAPKGSQEIEKEIAAMEKALRELVAKQGAAYWGACAENIKKHENQPSGDADVDAFAQGYKQACAVKDLGPLLKVLAEHERQVTAKTCKMGFVNKFTERLERIDANTWQGTDGPRGICNITVITTLWADVTPGAVGKNWNFKSVTSIPETENGPLCKDKAKVRVNEMRWRNPKSEWNLGCQYISM